MSGFIPVNLGDVTEQKPVKPGRYDLVISEVQEAKSQEGKPQLKAIVLIEGEDNAPAIQQYISLPSGEDDKKKSDFKVLLLKRFLTLFHVPFEAGGFNPQDMVGARAGSVELTLDTSTNKTTGKVGTYNRIEVPKLADETH